MALFGEDELNGGLAGFMGRDSEEQCAEGKSGVRWDVVTGWT